MSGYTTEQVMFIHRGSGANGKSVLMETMAQMMGEFYHKAPSSMLLTGFGDKIPADVADINSKRMVVMSETARGRTMNEDLMRDLCGGERVNARRLYGHFFQFEPVCKMHLITNHMPTISDAPATWRRLRVIHWKVVIPRDQWIKNLPTKFFSEEAAGILVWLVAGFRQWLQDGDLWEPNTVTEETGEEREAQDTLGEFIAECCDTSTPDGGEVSDSSANINQAYRVWAERASIRYPLTRRQLISTLQERDGIERIHKESYRGLKGLRVKPAEKGHWIGSRLPVDS
jgi:putative DNA primase/helicase